MNIDYWQVGVRIRSIRELKNMSIAELADKTNFTTKSLLLAENGKATLSLEFLVSICGALGVTPNDILRGQFPEDEFTLSAREALIEDFTVRLQEIQEGATLSRSKIQETDRTIEEISRMVDSKRREMLRNSPVDPPSTKKWRSSYYK